MFACGIACSSLKVAVRPSLMERLCFALSAAEIKLLQDRLHQREAESSGLQRQLGLMQVQIREAQRAQAAAAEAQTAAGAALDSQRAELAVLQQKLREAEVSNCTSGSRSLARELDCNAFTPEEIAYHNLD